MDAQLDKLDYPRHVHKPSVPGAWVYLVVESPADCAQALREGWSLTPILLPYPDAEPVAAPVAKKGRK